jgi:hypothetical protein
MLEAALKSEFCDIGRCSWIPAGALAASGLFMIMAGAFPGNFHKREPWRWLTWPSLTLALTAIATGFLRPGTAPGLGQRLTFRCFFLWVGLVGFGLARSQHAGADELRKF